MSDSKTFLDFWFVELHPKQHWIKDPKLDDEIKTRFERTLYQARACELFEWRHNPKGRLAEIIVLDQFSRNIYRELPESFIADPQALTLAQEAVAGAHSELEPLEKAFLYMPFMHSESAEIHKIAIYLFDHPGLEDNYNYELRHKEIIDRFGRYPHRNEILNRESTEEELEFLSQPGSGF